MEIGLDDGAVLGINGRDGHYALRCLAGCLYITRNGDHRDYCLEAGEQMEIDGRDQVVVEAWGEARFKCMSAAAVLPQRRSGEVWHLAGSA